MAADRRWPFWIFFLLLLTLYFTLSLGIGLGAEVPDLLTVAVLLAARRLRGAGAALVGFLVGLLRDALTLTAFGVDTILLTVLGYLGARSADLFEMDNTLFTFLYLFAGKWLHGAGFFLLARGLARGDAASFLLVDAPLAALYAAISGALLVGLYGVLVGGRGR